MIAGSPPARGFTLVELLVAMLLGVTLLFGLTQLFSNSRDGMRMQAALASVQDSGRVAVELLSRDIRNADFSGCLRDRSELANGLQGYVPGSRHEYFNLGSVSGQTADNTTRITGRGGRKVVPGTHTLQLVSALPVCEGVFDLAADQASAGSQLTLSGSCPGGIDDGTVLLVANCSGGEIFMKTGGSGSTIEHNGVYRNGDGIGNGSAAFRQSYGSGANVLQPLVYTYYVAQGRNGNNALYRRVDNTSYEMVPNVQSLLIEFGIDSNSDRAAEVFVAPSAGIDPAQIVAVRAILEVRSEALIGGNPLSRTFTATTNIRNRSAPAG